MYELWKQGIIDFSSLLILAYKKLGMTETEYAFLVLLAGAIKKNPTGWSLSEIANYMTLDTTACSRIFMKLINEGVILVGSSCDDEGRRFESYSLSPLFNMLENTMNQVRSEAKEDSQRALFEKMEHVFGLLSPRDIEIAQMWISDGFDISLIELAIAEMHMHDIRSIRYVDKILLDWKRKNIFTVDKAKRSLTEHRTKTRTTNTARSETMPANPDDYYDWIAEIKKKHE